MSDNAQTTVDQLTASAKEGFNDATAAASKAVDAAMPVVEELGHCAVRGFGYVLGGVAALALASLA